MIRILFILIVLSLQIACNRRPIPEKIIFVSGKYGNSDILMMDGNGKELKRLTTSETEEWSPAWINDNEIAFLRQKNDSIVIVNLNLTSGIETRLSQPDRCILDDKIMQFSPSTKSLLYVCDGDLIVESKILDSVDIVMSAHIDGRSNYAEWVNEDEIIFTNNRTGNNDIYLFNLTSNKLDTLTNSDSNDERASISPDGKFMVYSSDRFEKGNQDILIQNLKDSSIKNITQSTGTELIARWSRNGDKIIYGTNLDGNWEIYSYSLETEERVRLTNDPSFDGDPRIYYQ